MVAAAVLVLVVVVAEDIRREACMCWARQVQRNGRAPPILGQARATKRQLSFLLPAHRELDLYTLRGKELSIPNSNVFPSSEDLPALNLPEYVYFHPFV